MCHHILKVITFKKKFYQFYPIMLSNICSCHFPKLHITTMLMEIEITEIGEDTPYETPHSPMRKGLTGQYGSIQVSHWTLIHMDFTLLGPYHPCKHGVHST